MKCGMKNLSSSDNNGAIISNGAIMSQKAQKRFALFKEIGKEVPTHILRHGTVSQPEGTSNSSQAGSQAVDGNNDVMESAEDNDTTGNVGDQTVDTANLGGN